MTQPVISSSAKIQVVLDTQQAEKDLEDLKEKQPETAPVERHPRQASSKDAPPDPLSPGRELWHKTANARKYVGGWASTIGSGRLYDQLVNSARSVGTIGPVPVGAVVSAAELTRQYGPIGTGFARRTLQAAGVPQKVAEAAVVVPHEVAAHLNDLRAWATSVSPAIDSMKALVFAKARYDGQLSPRDTADITDFGLRVYEAEKLFTQVDARRNMWINERVGGALADLLAKTTAGSSGR